MNKENSLPEDALEPIGARPSAGTALNTTVYLPYPRLILGLRPANERRRYFVTTSLIGLAPT